MAYYYSGLLTGLFESTISETSLLLLPQQFTATNYNRPTYRILTKRNKWL